MRIILLILTSTLWSTVSLALPESPAIFLSEKKELYAECKNVSRTYAKKMRCEENVLISMRRSGKTRGTEEYFIRIYKPASTQALIDSLAVLQKQKTSFDSGLDEWQLKDELILITRELHKRKAYPNTVYKNGKIYTKKETVEK